MRNSVAGPGRVRSHDQPAEQDQAPVIVDAPACKILPRLLTVRLERQACRSELIEHRVKLSVFHADGNLGMVRFLWIWNIKIIRDAAKCQETRTDTQRRGDFIWNFNSG